MYYKSRSYQLSYVLIVISLILVSILCILPLIHIMAVSFSDKSAADANLITFWPIHFTTDAYAKTFENNQFFKALSVSIGRTVIGTTLGMIVTFLAAYPLSMGTSSLKSRNFYTWFFLVIMVFSGGLVPSYILMQKLHLLGSFWVLVLPGILSVWNIILMMNFFRNIPAELKEAATVDGATHFGVLFRILLPISMPAIATLSLFSMVGHWNSWFDGILYLNNANKWPLATLLQTIVVAQDFNKTGFDPSDLAQISNRSVKASQIFISMIPILLVYPFLQRFFVKGIVLGAVKE